MPESADSLLPLETSFADRRLHLGYRRIEALAGTVLGPSGTRFRGHEFHYTTILDEPDAPLAHVTDADGNPVPETGSIRGQVTGTFFHMIAEDRP